MKKFSEQEIEIFCSQAIDERRKFIESCEETNRTIASLLEMIQSDECEKLNSRSIEELYAMLDGCKNRELFLTLGTNAGLFDTLRDCLDDLTANRS